MSRVYPLLLLAVSIPFLPVGAAAQSAEPCSLDLQSSFGPFDYRLATKEQRELVERHHFTGRVEQLVRGESGTIGGDIAYTLRVFPNHPRALLAMAKLARREKTATPPGARYPVDCWFQRAVQFQPDDAQVRLVYGIDLLRGGKKVEAVEQLKLAEGLAVNDANVYYNLGLAYFDLNDFEKSNMYAKRAYELGFPLPGLRDKLKRAGAWRE
jgi:tetratricopeptide (TPR) repeat protein